MDGGRRSFSSSLGPYRECTSKSTWVAPIYTDDDLYKLNATIFQRISVLFILRIYFSSSRHLVRRKDFGLGRSKYNQNMNWFSICKEYKWDVQCVHA